MKTSDKSIRKIIDDVIKQVETSDDGLRYKLFGHDLFPFYVELTEYPGIYALERCYQGDMLVIKIYVDTSFFDIYGSDINRLDMYNIHIKIRSNTLGSCNINLSHEHCISIDRGINGDYNCASALFAGESLLNWLSVTGSLDTLNTISVLCTDMYCKDLVDNIVAFLLWEEGKIEGGLKRVRYQDITFYFMCRFKESFNALLTQINNLFVYLDGLSDVFTSGTYGHSLEIIVDSSAMDSEAYNEYDELVERNKFFMNIDIDEV